MIIRGRTLEQIVEESEVSNISKVTVAPKNYKEGTPAAEVVLLGQSARALQDTLARSNLGQGELTHAESLCIEMHRALCSIMVWIAKEEKRLTTSEATRSM